MRPMSRKLKRWCIVDQLIPVKSGDDIFDPRNGSLRVIFWSCAMPKNDWNWNPEFALRFWTRAAAETYKIVVLALNFHRRNISETVKVLKIPDRYL